MTIVAKSTARTGDASRAGVGDELAAGGTVPPLTGGVAELIVRRMQQVTDVLAKPRLQGGGLAHR